METNMPAKPDESKRLIKPFKFQTDAPLWASRQIMATFAT
jgi:hypothetical protein